MLTFFWRSLPHIFFGFWKHVNLFSNELKVTIWIKVPTMQEVDGVRAGPGQTSLRGTSALHLLSLDYDNVRRGLFLVNFGKNMPLNSQIFRQRRAKIVLTKWHRFYDIWASNSPIRGHHPSGASWGLSRHTTFVRTRIRHASGIVFRSNFTISTWDKEHQPSESSRAWLPTLNDVRETSRADSITINRPWQSFYSLLTNLLNYSPFWRGVQRTKKVQGSSNG